MEGLIMARIDSTVFVEDDKKTRLIENTVAVSKYLTGKVKGKLYFQINMYGSLERDEPNPPKKHRTQVLQIDEETARVLIEKFEKCFGWNVEISYKK